MIYAAYVTNDNERTITVYDGVFLRRKNALAWGLNVPGRLYIIPIRG